MHYYKILFGCVSLLQIFSFSYAGKVLFLAPICTKSETIMFYPLINEIARRGHEVTVVVSDPEASTKVKHSNVTTIVPFHYSEVLDPYSKVAMSLGVLDFVFLDVRTLVPFCHKTYSNPDFKRKVLDQKFDITIISSYTNECFLGVASKTDSKIILLNSFRFPNFFLDSLGLSYPVHSVPHPFLPQPPNMNFFDRILTLFANFAQIASTRFYYDPIVENVTKQYLGEDTPRIQDLITQSQLLLENSHYLTTGWRPSSPELVQVGGLHCSPAKPLPKDLEDFMNHPDGVIYVSFGSVARSVDLLPHIKDNLFAVLGKLKQRVIFQHIGEAGVIPKNFKFVKWCPQQDILGHKNMKLYIAHGGMFSMTEAVYHGVPVLGFPISFDQYANTKAAVNMGHAEELDIRDFDESQLEQMVNKILSTPKYAQRAKELSTIFRSGQSTPLEKAMYNIEFVMKFKDTNLPLSGARNLNFFQIHYFDIAAFLIGLALVGLLFLYKILTMIFCRTVKVDNSKKKMKTK